MFIMIVTHMDLIALFPILWNGNLENNWASVDAWNLLGFYAVSCRR